MTGFLHLRWQMHLFICLIKIYRLLTMYQGLYWTLQVQRWTRYSLWPQESVLHLGKCKNEVRLIFFPIGYKCVYKYYIYIYILSIYPLSVVKHIFSNILIVWDFRLTCVRPLLTAKAILDILQGLPKTPTFLKSTDSEMPKLVAFCS